VIVRSSVSAAAPGDLWRRTKQAAFGNTLRG
jgi:hypothetical protein